MKQELLERADVGPRAIEVGIRPSPPRWAIGVLGCTTGFEARTMYGSIQVQVGSASPTVYRSDVDPATLWMTTHGESVHTLEPPGFIHKALVDRSTTRYHVFRRRFIQGSPVVVLSCYQYAREIGAVRSGSYLGAFLISECPILGSTDAALQVLQELTERLQDLTREGPEGSSPQFRKTLAEMLRAGAFTGYFESALAKEAAVLSTPLRAIDYPILDSRWQHSGKIATICETIDPSNLAKLVDADLAFGAIAWSNQGGFGQSLLAASAIPTEDVLNSAAGMTLTELIAKSRRPRQGLPSVPNEIAVAGSELDAKPCTTSAYVDTPPLRSHTTGVKGQASAPVGMGDLGGISSTTDGHFGVIRNAGTHGFSEIRPADRPSDAPISGRTLKPYAPNAIGIAADDGSTGDDPDSLLTSGETSVTPDVDHARSVSLIEQATAAATSELKQQLHAQVRRMRRERVLWCVTVFGFGLASFLYGKSLLVRAPDPTLNGSQEVRAPSSTPIIQVASGPTPAAACATVPALATFTIRAQSFSTAMPSRIELGNYIVDACLRAATPECNTEGRKQLDLELERIKYFEKAKLPQDIILPANCAKDLALAREGVGNLLKIELAAPVVSGELVLPGSNKDRASDQQVDPFGKLQALVVAQPTARFTIDVVPPEGCGGKSCSNQKKQIQDMANNSLRSMPGGTDVKVDILFSKISSSGGASWKWTARPERNQK